MYFQGYIRSDGSVGVRNYVAVVAAQGYANTVVNGIAALVKGVVPITHPYGRGQIGLDDEQQARTLAGTILNPNVYAAVIIAWEPKEAEKIVTRVKQKSDKGCEVVTIVGEGSFTAIEKGARLALKLSLEASEVQREPVNISKLKIAVNCGASDATSGLVANPVTGYVSDKIIQNNGVVIFGETTEIMGAEHILAQRCNPIIAEKLLNAVKEKEDYVLGLGIDIRGNQPKPDNIEGGITTVEEKALGNIAKAGTAPIEDVIDYATIPEGKGLYHMYSSPAGAESNTGFFACGAQVIIFPTGKGNPVGHPLCPVIKVTGNPRTVKAVPENIDFDCSEVLSGKKALEAAGEELFSFLIRVASARNTCSEVIQHNEFAISRIGITV